MAKLARLTFTVPPQIVDDLAYVSARVGVSRSALVSDLLLDPLHDLRGLLESVPSPAGNDDMLRLRGKSEELIEQRLSDLRSALDSAGIK